MRNGIPTCREPARGFIQHRFADLAIYSNINKYSDPFLRPAQKAPDPVSCSEEESLCYTIPLLRRAG